MTYIALMVAAAAVYFWPQLVARLQQLRASAKQDQRQLFAIAVAVGCLIALVAEQMRPEPVPTPAPQPPAAFSLTGKFIGTTASQDAAMFSALCEELAAVIEFDGMQPEQRIKSGAAVEDLRVAAREARMRGVSLGARQPQVRDAVKTFLDEAAGTSGGVLSPEQRAAWIAAYREIGRAAADAAR